MLRRIATNLSLRQLTIKNSNTFCSQPPHPLPSIPRYRSFVSQYEIQKTMHSHILNLAKLSLQKGIAVEGRTKYYLQQAKNMKTYNNKYNKDEEKKQQEFRGQNFEPQNSRLKKIINFIFPIILLLAVSYFQPSERSGEHQSTRDGYKRIVTEQQMLNLLSKPGSYNSEIIIIRQMIHSDSSNRKIYQTVCLAKQNNKTKAPVTCIVINLSSFLQRLQTINIPYNVTFHYSSEEDSGTLLDINIGKWLFFAFLGFIAWKARSLFKSGSMGEGGFNQMLNMNKYEPIKPENIKTLFKDVAGMHEAKQQITEFVDFLKNPDKYIQMGAKVPKGALLTGPPGTGKTLLARACAGQAAVPFFYVSGSEFVQKYVGLGANRVRNLFTEAAKSAPSIIFIDQIDAIGKKRNSGPFSNQEKENTLNQLLVNMDGFDSKNKIIVMAATNLKDSLDPALLRPGRFDRSIQINLPNFEERAQILKVHLTKVKFIQKFSIEELAKKISVLTPGFSGAQLANICNQAAILAARANKDAIDLPQFEKATERVMAGLQKRNLFSEEEKQCLAYYECGKAVVSWFTQGADPIVKISITPYSKQNKGYSHQIKDQMPLKTKTQLWNKAMCFLAGRTAQKYFKGYITSNGDSDMKRAKRILSFMVSKLGMSPKIGRIGYPDIEYTRKPYSEYTESKIDQQVGRMFKQCQDIAQKIVIEKAQLIEKLKMMILQKETITHNTLKQILGQRPFSDNQNYQKYLKDSEQPKTEDEVTMSPPAN